MASIQFYGLEKTIDAFENRNCPAYSLWVGRQFLGSYVGGSVDDAAGNLEKFLEMFDPGTTATYTLKVYEEPPAKITDKTPCDGSFNFKLNKSDETVYGKSNIAVLERLGQIEAKLSGPTEGNNVLGQIGDYVENNEWAQKLLLNAVGHFLKIPGLQQQAQQLGQFNQQQQPPAIDQELLTIIKQLQLKDAKLKEHLAKLVAMNDMQFQFLLQAVDNMQ